MSSFKVLIASNSILVSMFMMTNSILGATNLSSNFSQSFDITWGRTQILNGGQTLTLNLDKSSGSGFRSKSEFIFGRIDMQIKLVPGNSAGTVTTFYLSSEGPTHDEVDFEFLGNSSGQPYTLHTNVFSQGKGNREQQFRLWFDPTKTFNTYSVLWNRKNIIFFVNNIPIRVFNNTESSGVPYPKKQPMRIYASLWNADDWATQGGRVKTDWSKAPFSASYANFKAKACVSTAGNVKKSSCDEKSSSADSLWLDKGIDDIEDVKRLRWAQRRFRIYDYCSDIKRFPQGLPIECKS